MRSVTFPAVILIRQSLSGCGPEVASRARNRSLRGCTGHRGIAAAFVLYFIASGHPGFTLASNGLAVNGFGDLSPGGYSMEAGIVTELILTAFFLIIIMGSTHDRAPLGFAPIAIGLGLTLIHLISIPVTNTSVNPARSTGPAVIVGGEALRQLWMFWVAPIAGGLLGGALYRWLSPSREQSPTLRDARSTRFERGRDFRTFLDRWVEFRRGRAHVPARRHSLATAASIPTTWAR